MRFVFAFALLLSTLHPALAAPSADLWARWQAHNNANTQSVQFPAWAAFLQKYVRPAPDGVNRVAYGSVSAGDRQAIEAEVQQMQSVPVSSLSQPEQRAFWTNLYNELTVLVVLQHYPTESITKINLSHGLFSSDGPWDAKVIQVEGEKVSLNDIEHRILRPIWRDPRTHYSLNCASLGCPNLQQVPYTRANMEELLNKGAAEYVNHPRGYEVKGGKLAVSSIYVWYQADFGGNDAGVINHLRQYSRPEKQQTLNGIADIASNSYNWALNDAARR